MKLHQGVAAVFSSVTVLFAVALLLAKSGSTTWRAAATASSSPEA
jgi:hypothetical protein